jgi:filamentous hemagglutinin family protein
MILCRLERLLPMNSPFLSIINLIGTLVFLNVLPNVIVIGTNYAEAMPPITPSGLHTQVSDPIAVGGQTQYNITGGTRPGGVIGTNLFLSFGDFGVPANHIANFLNTGSFDLAGHPLPADLQTLNILARVTGSSGNNPALSSIYGTIQTTDFGNANLFLMNPAGFLFGPNATVNVGGMVAFTSADYLRLADNVKFNAIPNAAADALLTPSPVAAFGFLGSNPGAITVQGSQFTVTEGTGISLVGGNITIQPGTLDDGTVQPAKLTSPSGQINLASMASPGEVLSSSLQLGTNVNGESFTSLGSVTIGQDARIDTAGATGGTIAIRGGQLTIADGAAITSAASSNPPAPAGSVTINGAGVQMTGSDVVINGTNVSITGSQVTAAKFDGSGGTIAITAGSTDQPGNVSVTQNALLDASGTSGGSITIRGGQLTIADATLSANTGNTPGVLTAIDINVTGDLTISDSRGTPAIAARTTGAGDAGEVLISSANFDATTSVPAETFHTLIDTHSSGTGAAGSVTIATGNLTVAGPAGTFLFIDSGPQALGPGGNVTITAQGHVDLSGTTISTGAQFAEILGMEAGGPGGNLTLTADTMRASDAHFITEALSSLAKTERGGDVTMNVRDITMMPNTGVSAGGTFGGGAITINADRLFTDATTFSSFTFFGPGKGITFNGRILELTNGSSWSTSTFGDFNAGNITVNATDHVSLIGFTGTSALGEFNPSGFFTNSLGFFGTQGSAGNIFVTTPKLTMIEGRINTSTATSGRGGDVTVNAGLVEMSGEFPNPTSGDFFFNIGNIHPSGIFTETVGSEFCAGPCGNAGNITANIGSLVMGPGSQINSGTSNTGQGGNITIRAIDTLSISGTLSNGSPVGIFSRTVGTTPDAGPGGNIALTGGQSVTISDHASVSASSTGPGSTGNIQINAGNQFAMTNSTVTTEADQASGGAIKISTTPNGTVQLTDSTISASVLDGTGGGGSVNIDPQLVLLLNSQIRANAVQGPGGNISITTNFLLPDANSVISATSQFGTNGTVTIQSPNAPISGQIQPLGKSPLLATTLLNQHCAALAGGEFSSFTVAGRDSLPTEPGSWLASPLALGPAGFSAGAVPEGGAQARVIDPAQETTVLSLRQIAPAGFLTQAFAVDWLASCQS